MRDREIGDCEGGRYNGRARWWTAMWGQPPPPPQPSRRRLSPPPPPPRHGRAEPTPRPAGRRQTRRGGSQPPTPLRVAGVARRSRGGGGGRGRGGRGGGGGAQPGPRRVDSDQKDVKRHHHTHSTTRSAVADSNPGPCTRRQETRQETRQLPGHARTHPHPPRAPHAAAEPRADAGQGVCL